MNPRISSPLLWLALLLGACSGGATDGAQTPTQEASEGAEARSCPSTAPAPDPLPHVTERHRSLAYWLERAGEGLDAPLMTPVQIAAHNRALTGDADNGLPIDRASLERAPDAARLNREVQERLTYMREKLAAGDYVDAAGARVDPETFADRPVAAQPVVRIALAETSLRCGPRVDGLFKVPVDPDFDRNNCSTVRPQEPVQILVRWPNGMSLARTRYALGWLAEDAPLSAPVDGAILHAVLHGAPMQVAAGVTLAAEDGAELSAEHGALLPRDPEDTSRVLFADERGVHRAPAASLRDATRPLTRRAFLEEAFSHLGRPYGWGGHAGGLDCSRFVMDVLATFGLELPRHSGRQAHSGTNTISFEGVEDDGDRLRLLDAAARRGVVLLHFPGHIMVYLGRDEAERPYAIHAFSEYVEPCEGEQEILRRVDRVAVSDLSLGDGSSRGSFLERVTEAVVIGQQIGPELIGVASPRAAAPVVVPEASACDDSLAVRIFRSPERPHPGQPMRVMVTATEELGPVELALIDPSGRRRAPELHRLGGPPFTYWAQIDAPEAGRWTAVLGDGPNVAACERITVTPYPAQPETVHPEVVWEPRFRWEADTEALFSAFVERLFDYPVDEELTWPNLSVLLLDRDRNLLFDHFSQGEEERIPLRPDCADLPYFLRTYFAWKLRLPFAYRVCTRGRHGNLPTCEETIRTPQWAHEQVDAVEAFRAFIVTQVKRGVHSASGRTHPEDSQTALYPVPMTREALRPGTVFADPYGHLLVVARWLPQGSDEYGILVGADAQPDGTVGRRRFWRGSFLFHPDTTHVGAGFKGWRPIVYDRREQSYTALANEEITARAGYTPYSLEQYAGTTDEFYERMEGLINPRPLDPIQVQISLIDALDESIARRVVSVDNGERWVRDNGRRTMEMPEGGAIFQTGGPWEEYSTPSRDMRLLIAMDTVTGFPEVVRRNPERFGLSDGDAADVDAAVERVRARQQETLRSRTFQYVRSDGQSQQLTLADVIARARGFEMSYNPNDCIEIRWAAPEGSPEMQSCRRHAPAEHRARMREYRTWFSTRRRPIY
ncbi:MAG: NlpC/P60 family protein [Sandaracinaceae bacterium]